MSITSERSASRNKRQNLEVIKRLKWAIIAKRDNEGRNLSRVSNQK